MNKEIKRLKSKLLATFPFVGIIWRNLKKIKSQFAVFAFTRSSAPGSLKKFDYEMNDVQTRQFLHRDTVADRGVVDQIFINKDYSLDRLRRGVELENTYKSILESGKTPLIIDAGANIGASALWFASKFPGANIVCFEPEPENFSLLEKNSSGLTVELHLAAVGARDGMVNLFDPGEGEWGYRTEAAEAGSVNMLSMDRIVSEKISQGLIPFIAKIDIEGGEDNLFSENTSWVNEFPLIIIELHDWMLPKQRSSANFLRVISALNRDFVYIGENIFSIQ